MSRMLDVGEHNPRNLDIQKIPFPNLLIHFLTIRNDVEAQENRARLASCMWLYNPLVMNVSTRGSAESVIVALVLLTIHLYQQKVFILTGLMYGLAIHMKIYPIIYCLSLYLPLTNETGMALLVDRIKQYCQELS